MNDDVLNISNPTMNSTSYVVEENTINQKEQESMGEEISSSVVNDNSLDLIISIDLNVEKIPNKGEDAPPIYYFYERTQVGCIAVLDGLGGSGAQRIMTDGVEKTAAYIASRRVRDYISDFLEQLEKNEMICLDELLIDKLTEYLKTQLNELNKSVPESKLKNNFRRNFPTTLASIFFQKNNDSVDVISAWAGDSRCFVLRDSGLSLMSKDDNYNKVNASLKEYMSDSNMTNLISSDNNFVINRFQVSIASPCILIVATDGCFDYFKSPMEFEYLLLKCFNESKTKEEWMQKFSEYLTPIAGDDYSLSIACIGFESYLDIKENLKTRFDALSISLDDLVNIERKIQECNEQIDNLRDSYSKNLNNFWESTKEIYFGLIVGDGNE